MQTVDFISTSKWILAQYPASSIDALLEARRAMHIGDVSDRKKFLIAVLAATSELAVIAERLNAHPHAPEVLRAFGLDMLLDRKFAVQCAEFFATNFTTERPERIGLGPLDEMAAKWYLFTNCLPSVERLVVPPQVVAETDFDEVLTVELRYDGDLYPRVDTFIGVLKHVQTLYDAISRVYGAEAFSPLVIIYADSGSSVRIDLRGMGEPIREIKNLLVELWTRFRHRRIDDYRAASAAFLDGIGAIARLEELHKTGAITAEDLSRSKHDILTAGVGLFEAGALPREIPRVEVISNQKVINDIHRKLLAPAPAAADEAPGPTASVETLGKSAKHNKRRPRKRKKAG